jgi:hypothetical protein
MIALGDPRAAAATFLRQRRAAEQAGSSPLQLLGAAWHAYNNSLFTAAVIRAGF